MAVAGFSVDGIDEGLNSNGEGKAVLKRNVPVRKKKMLVYAHYYAPDVASTSQIIQDLAEGMKDKFEVTVICTVPSYTGKIDGKYKEKRTYKEELNGVHIIRIPVPEFSKSDKKSRVKNLFVYYLNARKATGMAGLHDYVFTISQPPIIGGMLGVYGKNKLRTKEGKKPKLIYCIQDFNPEQVEAVGYVKIKLLLNMAQWIDKRSCRKSDLVITVGRDLVDTLKSRMKGSPMPKYTMINNWIDDNNIYPVPMDNPEVAAFKRRYKLENKFIIMYSGNIGLYYDLEGLIRVIGKFQNTQTPDGRIVVFAFVGAGAVLDKLMEYKTKHRLDNVVFIPYQDKGGLIYSLNAADVHWCVNAKGIKGVSCPSKFYGIAGVSKPVIAVLEKDSEVERVITETGCGRVSEPGDYDDVARNIHWFISHAGSDELTAMGRRGYEYLIKNLTKNTSISRYMEEICGL